MTDTLRADLEQARDGGYGLTIFPATVLAVLDERDALRALLREAVDGHYACETDNDGWHERARAALGEE